MGGIVCISADISALEKETIVNTRANKVRDLAAKLAKNSGKPTEWQQGSESESLESLQASSNERCKRRMSVEFFSVVRERVYFEQDEAAEPVFQDLNHTLMKRTDLSCNSGLYIWSSRTKVHNAVDSNRPLRPSL